MKKELLMHGDLLMYYGHLCRFVIRSNGATIERLDDKSEYLPCSCESDKAEPIPITDEILEANGFVREGCVSWNREYHVNVQHWSPNNKVLNGTGKERNPINIPDIVYVHELQNALRLVGLTELADNFKIE